MSPKRWWSGSKDPKIQVLKGPDTQSVNISFNNSKPPFDDVRVRQALGGYGIDRHAIAKVAMLGLGKPLWSFVPPGGKDHIDFEEQFPYNPDKAKALLKEAGFDDKNPLKYTIMTHSAEPSLPTVATIIKTQMAKIGVEVTIEVLIARCSCGVSPPIATGISSSTHPVFARRQHPIIPPE